MAQIKFYQGLKANLPVTGELSALYFCTDSLELYQYQATGMKLYSNDVITIANSTAVTSPEQGKLYVFTDDWTINAYNGTIWKVLGGNFTANSTDTLTNKTIDATTNTITNLGTTNFDPNAISTTINETTPLDTKLTTEKSVVDYVTNKTALLASGLIYKGAIDASNASNLPTTIKTGDYYVISVAGTIGTLDLQIGDMLIANKSKSTGVAITDFDKIDNTEASDILRTSNISTDADFTVDGTKLTDRTTIKTFVESKLEWATF
jgi:hypothetical protein